MQKTRNRRRRFLFGKSRLNDRPQLLDGIEPDEDFGEYQDDHDAGHDDGETDESVTFEPTQDDTNYDNITAFDAYARQLGASDHAPVTAIPEPVPTLPSVPTELAAVTPPTVILGSIKETAFNIEHIMTVVEGEAEAARREIDRQMKTGHDVAARTIAQAHIDADRIRTNAEKNSKLIYDQVDTIIEEAHVNARTIVSEAETTAEALTEQARYMTTTAREEAREIVAEARIEGEQILIEQRRLAATRAHDAAAEQERLREQIRRLEQRRIEVLESLEPLVSQLTKMLPDRAAEILQSED